MFIGDKGVLNMQQGSMDERQESTLDQILPASHQNEKILKRPTQKTQEVKQPKSQNFIRNENTNKLD